MHQKVVVFDIHSKLAESFKTIEELNAKLMTHADPKICLAAAAEMRRHIRLAVQTLDIIMRGEAMKDFQAGVLQALADARIPIRRKVMGLFEARAQITESEDL